MKKTSFLLGTFALLATANAALAQDHNLVMNGSFEKMEGKKCGPIAHHRKDSITSSNHTSVDFYLRDKRGTDYNVPENYMGNQDAHTGDGYAGITAYYADETGIFTTRPGYGKYSEYVQFKLREPLQAGKPYQVVYNVSLAEKSAYAVSGLGVYFSRQKMDVENNAFLDVTPHMVVTEVLKNNDWVTITGTYVAGGGERYLTLGCFDTYMATEKIIPPFTHDSRKAYYFIDDVSVAPTRPAGEEVSSVSSILYGLCYQLDNLNFETDKATILSDSFDELDGLSDFLKTYPYVVVYIDGHTDKTGTTAYNNTLSEKRAAAVKNYLVNDGVHADRLRVRGHGESAPIDLENEESQANRRVEIVICGAVASE